MKITLKLYASLSEHLPPGARGNAVELEVPPAATAAWVMEQQRLPRALTHLVLVNGVFAPPSERARTPLAEGDVLAVWPPVAGG